MEVCIGCTGDLQTAKLEKIADGLFSPQTPVLSRDGKRLFVADYTMGVAVIDLPASGATPSSRKINYLPHPDNVAVVTLDGLYRSDDSLIGIQNGTEPVRILRIQLNPAQTEIQAFRRVSRSDSLIRRTPWPLMDGFTRQPMWAGAKWMTIPASSSREKSSRRRCCCGFRSTLRSIRSRRSMQPAFLLAETLKSSKRWRPS